MLKEVDCGTLYPCTPPAQVMVGVAQPTLPLPRIPCAARLRYSPKHRFQVTRDSHSSRTRFQNYATMVTK